jgi:hypothetical protein
VHSLLNERRLSTAQLVCLKSLYGLPLTLEELPVYERRTGRHDYDAREQGEITIISGRRSGKTLLAALICIFEAFRNHGLPDGEEAYVMLLAATVKQARIAFRYIRKYLRQSLFFLSE